MNWSWILVTRPAYKKTKQAKHKEKQRRTLSKREQAAQAVFYGALALFMWGIIIYAMVSAYILH